MASTFTANNQFEKPGHGDDLNSWDSPLNNNFDVLDQSIDGVAPITLNSTTYTLSAPANSTTATSHCKVLVFSGSPGGAATVTITPNTLQKRYWIVNKTNQVITFTTGTGSTATVIAGARTMIYLDGSGSVSDLLGSSGSNLVVGGSVTANGVTNTANASVTGTLAVTGTTTLNGLTNSADTALNGTTELNGAVTLGAGLNLNGQTLTGTATLSGNLTLSGTDTFTGAPKFQAGTLVGSASAGSPQTLQLTNSPGAPIAGRLLFGTDNTGWQFRIGKNVAGTITDYVLVSDSGTVTFQNGAGVNVTDGLTVSAGGLALGSQTVSGNPTFTGNPVFSGNPNFTGTPTFSHLTLASPTISNPTLTGSVTFGAGYQAYTPTAQASTGSITAVSITGQYLIIGQMCHVMINGSFTVPAPQSNIPFIFVSLPITSSVGPTTPAAINVTNFSGSPYCYVQPAPGALSSGLGAFNFIFSSITPANQTIGIAANATYRIS